MLVDRKHIFLMKPLYNKKYFQGNFKKKKFSQPSRDSGRYLRRRRFLWGRRPHKYKWAFAWVKRKWYPRRVWLKKLASKRKPKKRLRAWYLYKRFMRGRRRKRRKFTKLKWIFGQKRVLLHQLSRIYGCNFKRVFYKTHKRKVILNGKSFVKLLWTLELRLDIVIFRLLFARSLLKANKLISNSKILVGRKLRHKCYILKCGDIVRKIKKLRPHSREKIRGVQFHRLRKRKKTRKRWRWWAYFRRFRKKAYRSTWYLFQKRKNKKKNIINFFEVNDKISSACLLRYPRFKEFRLLKSGFSEKNLRRVFRLY